MNPRKRQPASEFSGTAELNGTIRIRGARVHNLQDVDLDIPRNQLVVITGPSGSGKSSLAFDTLYAEGQRQYIESLSVYARQFLHQLERPDVDLVEGLQPTLSIDQHAGSRNPRSTVATMTEIYDHLKLLFARAGTPSCHACGEPIQQQTLEQIQDRLLQLPEGTKAMLLAPMVRGRKGRHRETIAAIRKAGFIRARVDGEIIDMDQASDLAPGRHHDIDAVVDRLIIRAGIEARLAESIRLAVKHGEGSLIARYQQPVQSDNQPSNVQHESDTRWHDQLFSTKYACGKCGTSLEELEPRTFSFNSPYGACPECEGLGHRAHRDDELTGSDQESPHAALVCSSCAGSRLRPEARSVHVGGKAIHEITGLSIGEARKFIESVTRVSSNPLVAGPIAKELFGRLDFLDKVGVAYLTLDRPADTLSGGELQRVRLATSIGSGLVGVCYILDEPSIGLHPRDNQQLICALRELQQQGNTVLIVEHDDAMMRQADQIIDMGPAAGTGGGRVVAQGTPNQVGQAPDSLTGNYLSGRQSIQVPIGRRRIAKSRSLTISGVSTNNLKHVDVTFPLSALVCVTGVSGSGKSSLLNETLVPALLKRLGSGSTKPGPFQGLRGASQIDKLVNIDQSPIGRTPRSNPATYTGVFDEVRRVFKQTRLARQRGYGMGRFSFNVRGGRCEECQGQGVQKIEMKFLPDLYVTCNTCRGTRFNRQTLQVRYRGQSIADVLAMRVGEAADFFTSFPVIHRCLKCLRDVGLDYLPLGQPSTTLSGGEAQRIKLATQLARAETGCTLYVLDEPTTGLHPHDIQKLLDVLGRLVDQGNTVIVIEHHVDVMKSADWIIDLGPEGGAAGGEVTATGTPEEVAAIQRNHTAEALRIALGQKMK